MKASAVPIGFVAAATIAFAGVARPNPAAQQVITGQQTFQGPPGGGPGRGGPPGAPLQGTPPRDGRSTTPAGTAVIRGRVLAADTGRPLRRARIVVNAPELGPMPANAIRATRTSGPRTPAS